VGFWRRLGEGEALPYGQYIAEDDHELLATRIVPFLS